MSLKLNTYVKGINIINTSREKIIFNIIMWSFAVLAVLYFLFLGSMVKNILERKSIESQVSTLSNEVQGLELQYLSLSNSVDLPLSYSMGFKEVKTTFATHQSLGLKTSGSKIAQNDL
ncbi:MAG: hypothetical protein WCI76_02275 [bacterium]